MHDLSLRESIPDLYLLPQSDLIPFTQLHKQLACPDVRYHRRYRIVFFESSFTLINSFCIRNTADDWRRCLVCGVCWLGPDEIAVNARRLQNLLARSKSSINGVLALMHYNALRMEQAQAHRLSQAIPWLETHPTEARQWTIRKRMIIDNDPFASKEINDDDWGEILAIDF
jgi:hypothetical protein